MSEKKKDIAAQNKREDEMLNRTLLWICGAAVLLLFLLFINRYGFHYRVSEISLAVVIVRYLIPAVTVAALCGCAAGIALFKKAPTKWRGVLAIFCGGLAACGGAAFLFQGTGVEFMCAVVPAMAILALVYYLFQREFFLIALVSGIGIADLWIIRRAAGSHPAILYGSLVASLALIAALAFFAHKLQAASGKWQDRQLLSKNAAYTMLYVTCALMAVLLLAAVVVGYAYYLLFPAVGWLIIMAVYFTVKLM